MQVHKKFPFAGPTFSWDRDKRCPLNGRNGTAWQQQHRFDPWWQKTEHCIWFFMEVNLESWLNILDQATTFQVVALLPDVHRNPTSTDVLEALHSHWIGWCGYPERGVVTDRAKYFLADLAEDFDNHGWEFRTSARASPWQIGQVESRGMEEFGSRYSESFPGANRSVVEMKFFGPHRPPHRPRMI